MPLPMNFNSLPLSRFFISVILKHRLSCGTQALIKTTFSQPSITCIANFQINKKNNHFVVYMRGRPCNKTVGRQCVLVLLHTM